MSQQPGWYDDPQDADLLRYWDGVQWTSHTSPRQRPNLDQAGQGQNYGQGQGYGQGGQGQGYGGSGQGQGNPYGGSTTGSGQQQWGSQQGQGQQQWGGQQGYGYAPAPGMGGYSDPRETTPDGQRISGWWRRFFARILDAIILGVITLVLIPLLAPDVIADVSAWMDDLVVAMEAGATTFEDLPERVFEQLLVLGLVSGILGLVYETVLVTLLGGTLGKLALGLRVRLRDQPGNVNWATSGVRALVWRGPGFLGYLPLVGEIMSFVGWVFILVNGLWPLWDAKRQSLNDKVAKTNVVRKG